jgi:hypothetical protein
MPEPCSVALIQLVTTKSNRELADEFRDRMVTLTIPVMALFDEILAAGFECSYECGKDFRDKHIVTRINIVKKF